ncbi:hypothetical protein ACFE04_015699 [Oxalis oulophora]
MGRDKLLLATVGPPIKPRTGLRRKQAGRVFVKFVEMSSTTDLHQLLKTLCTNSVWDYAVFWKLNRRSQIVLTWEDAYYDNCEQHTLLENKCFGETAENFHIGNYSLDPLVLVLAKMSYHVYSLGEGIVGQAAVTQKDQWIFADATDSSFQSCDGWENQFSAGVKTVAVVAIFPHGVMQLGSLNKVTEDTMLATQVREAFFTLQEYSVGHVTRSLCPPDFPAEVFPDCLSQIDKSIEIEGESTWLPPFPYFKKNNIFPVPFCFNDFPDVNSMNSYGTELQYENFGVNNFYASSSLESAICDEVYLKTKDSSQNEDSLYCESSENNPQAWKSKFENPTMLSHSESSDTNLKFWAGSELHEALGQAFSKKNINSVWENEKIEAGTNFEMNNGPTVSQLTFEPGSENLLEVVVSNTCHSSSDVKRETSLSKSIQSLLTTDKMPERSRPVEKFPCMSNEPAKNNKKKGRPGENSKPRPRDRQLIQDRIKELRELVPTGSKCSIDSLLERTIKHLGFLQSITKHADKLSKCAEAKVMVPPLFSGVVFVFFIRCRIQGFITVKGFFEAILTHKRPKGILGPSDYEQGSSWAVEVGGHLKVCSIVVENLNKKGQMLVEMVCEECSHFLEIAEAIRSLGLTILKAVTEAQGDKMWICFVVEMEEVIENSNSDNDQFSQQVKSFMDSKAGVKGLVDSGLVKLPRIFVQPPEHRSSNNSSSNVVGLTIPVIDMKNLDDRRKQIVHEIRKAAETWGICQLINHGVPTDVIDGVLDGVNNFHEQPQEIKNEFYEREQKKILDLNVSSKPAQPIPLGWMDVVVFSFPDQQLAEDKIPQVCRKAIYDYTEHIFQLKDTLTQILSEALGLCPDYLANIECMRSMLLFGNCYPACPEPHLALGSNYHVDPHFLTILAQDNVGGLEVVHDNQRLIMPCIHGSLILNFGSMMQIISNDKFKGVVHRVLAGPKTRISVACHFSPSSRKMETEYGPLKEIISDDNPPIYRHLTPSEFMAQFQSSRGQKVLSKFMLEQN